MFINWHFSYWNFAQNKFWIFAMLLDSDIETCSFSILVLIKYNEHLQCCHGTTSKLIGNVSKLCVT